MDDSAQGAAHDEPNTRERMSDGRDGDYRSHREEGDGDEGEMDFDDGSIRIAAFLQLRSWPKPKRQESDE